MKQLIRVILVLVVIFPLVGCKKLQTSPPELVPQSLSSREEVLLNLTGNKVLLYSLTHMPPRDGYELSLTYEVYENGEKVKEALLLSLMNPDPDGHPFDETIGLNFQSNEIRVFSGNNHAYASGNLQIEEDLSQYAQAFLGDRLDLPLGTEVYIYYANDGDSIATNSPIGMPLSSVNMNDFFHTGESVILIKLSFQASSN